MRPRVTGALHHIALRTRDVGACVGFYRDVIGLEERARSTSDDGSVRSVWLACDGVVLMIERAGLGEPTVPRDTYELIAWGITMDARESWRAWLAAHGVTVEAETAATLYVRDPDGRRVGLSGYAFGG